MQIDRVCLVCSKHRTQHIKRGIEYWFAPREIIASKEEGICVHQEPMVLLLVCLPMLALRHHRLVILHPLALQMRRSTPVPTPGTIAHLAVVHRHPCQRVGILLHLVLICVIQTRNAIVAILT